MRTHQEIDARSLAWHRLVAAKTRQDPQLFEAAKATLARWRSSVCASSQPYLAEWERLMNLGMETCLDFASEDSERATAMRQCSPLACVLSNKERFVFLRQWQLDHATQRPGPPDSDYGSHY